MVPDIEIQHLSVCFDTAQGPVYAVNDLSTTFRAGRISGVIGESGSGKSVMGMSLLRLLPNTARVTGKCFFGEDELYSMPLRRLRRLRGAAIGLIPQNPGASLDPVMKLRRQLTEAITTHGRRKRREAEAQAAELLRRFGFEEPERILNNGQGRLNRNGEADAFNIVGVALHNLGVDNTHDLALARRRCDDSGVLDRGRSSEQGTAEEVMERPRHPYTAGLIRSLPSRGMVPIPPPDPGRLEHTGCPFYPRCPRAMERCGREALGEVTLPTGGKVRCFLYE